MKRRTSARWSTTPFFSILVSIVAIVVRARPRSGSSVSCTSDTVASPWPHRTRMMASCRSPRWWDVSMSVLLGINYRDSTTRVVDCQWGDTKGGGTRLQAPGVESPRPVHAQPGGAGRKGPMVRFDVRKIAILFLLAASAAQAQPWLGPAGVEVRVEDQKGLAVAGAPGARQF